ncbi:MAG: hypothetical protein Q7S58_13025 [Candidatus Binatus sp.]|uniref:DUF6998 domain-containing protein n=1 Tax=Candidatus Binatus sp. TaxID=2811406 RepID=UPI00271D82B3|nr:hypothetical protein [Candidatus Binatus sp.]MDO8433322.1 hypothetical protein [Candidatus Binatus sp.]
MTKLQAISDSLGLIVRGIEQLRAAFPNQQFTIDGRLVGDIGEVIAERDYDLTLHLVQQPGHDAVTSDGRDVQIKATFKDSLTFVKTPAYYLGFKLYEDGHYEEIYNGPGEPIYDRYQHRKGIGETLLSFPIGELRELSQHVQTSKRIPKRKELNS